MFRLVRIARIGFNYEELTHNIKKKENLKHKQEKKIKKKRRNSKSSFQFWLCDSEIQQGLKEVNKTVFSILQNTDAKTEHGGVRFPVKSSGKIMLEFIDVFR